MDLMLGSWQSASCGIFCLVFSSDILTFMSCAERMVSLVSVTASSFMSAVMIRTAFDQAFA